jgi:TonB-linked SusC/RagA family outer membrane protein
MFNTQHEGALVGNRIVRRIGHSVGLALLALIVTSGAALAQTGRLEGVVRNGATGAAVEGARVTIDGLNLSAISNAEGRYSIDNVAAGQYRVQAQVIGFQTVILTAQNVRGGAPTIVNFDLQPSVLRLDGIVVTGVADETESVKLAFTVDQITAADIPVLPVGTPEEAIRGKVAGAKIVRSNGEPGGGVSVLLRGATSINSGGRSNEPLYVVDGVILGASMTDIDATDIASIEVLKGAAAASLYGARAANGVISIRTNRGRNITEGTTRIRLRTEFGRNYLGKKVALSDHHGYLVDESLGPCMVPISPIPGETGMKQGTCWVDDTGALVARDDRELDDKGLGAGGFFDNEYAGEHFDHLDLFFNPGTFSTQSATITHRNGPTNFSSTFSRTEEGGIILGNDGYERKSVRVNLDHSLAQNLELSVSGFYSNSTSDGNPDATNAANPFFDLMFLERDADLLQPNSDGEPFLIRPDVNALEENPLYKTHNDQYEQRRSRTLGNFRVRWFPVQSFDLEADFSFDRSDRNRFEFYKVGYKTVDPASINDGQVDRNNDFDQALNASLTARYITRFLNDDLGSTSSARVLLERTEFEQFFARANDLVVNNVNDLDVGDETESSISSQSQEVKSLGYFFSQDFDLKDRYIFSGVLRRDGSSLFGGEERWHTYYRIGGAYRVSQEPWWPIGFLDEFKLRFSRGTAGGRPRFSAQYETFTVSGGVVNKGVLGNTELKPEFATENEAGIDMILGGRLSATVTYAQSTVEDQLLQAPLPSFFGFGSQWKNAGTLESKTWEASLQTSIVATPDFGWDMSVVFDRTRQEITQFDIPAYEFGGRFYNREGEAFGSLYGTRFMTGCDQLQASVHPSCDGWVVNDDGYLVPVGAGNSWQDGVTGSLWGTTVTIDGVDYAWGIPVGQDSTLADGTTNSNFLRIGNTTPDFNLGFTQTVRWKNLSLYALFDAQIGGDVYNATKQWSYRDQRHGDNDQFGKDDATIKPEFYSRALYNTNSSASHFVEDATYLKFRELNLRYVFNQRALSNLFGGFLNRLTLSVVGRNLLTWTGYTGFDPEAGENGANAAIQRVDSFDYPNYRTFTGSIEIEF